jgi:hypothetical protein
MSNLIPLLFVLLHIVLLVVSWLLAGLFCLGGMLVYDKLSSSPDGFIKGHREPKEFLYFTAIAGGWISGFFGILICLSVLFLLVFRQKKTANTNT